MDPNQRLFLESAWAAVEDAGYGGKSFPVVGQESMSATAVILVRSTSGL